MIMTDEEIFKSYRDAKRRRRQPAILAELNGCEVEKIKRIVEKEALKRGKYDEMFGQKQKRKLSKADIEVIELYNKGFSNRQIAERRGATYIATYHIVRKLQACGILAYRYNVRQGEANEAE